MEFDITSYLMGTKSAGSSGDGNSSESRSIPGGEYIEFVTNTGDLIVIGRNSISVKAIYWIDITLTPILIAGSTTGISVAVAEGITKITNTNTGGVAIGCSIYRAPWKAN